MRFPAASKPKILDARRAETPSQINTLRTLAQ